MEAQEIFLKENLRFLRERRKMTQQALAEDLGFSRVKLNAIESGKTANPVLEDVVGIAKYFKLAADTLLTVKLSKLGELKLRELESGSDVYLTGKNIRVLAITVAPDQKENVEYIPVKAKAGYRAGFADPQYLAELPKFNIPNLPSGTFRMFPTIGDSMLPVPEESQILARYVQDWKSLKPDTLCIVILKADQDFVFKQVTIQQDGLRLHSMNRLYEDYVVAFSDVLEIWEYYSFHSRQLPEALSDLAVVIREIRKLEERMVLNL
ncbi:helix-turn-helix domain-containing protein [Dyadobacter sp. NIV53]|uniref:XRE family transcriptional regulator n=1 Tax=Dyadobacter sp. NIV53 TaxID=2861765 RepID=UPI001C885772|nr:helix-turn-helix domain-containing protein [Dyadobacter sp. NIV53]